MSNLLKLVQATCSFFRVALLLATQATLRHGQCTYVRTDTQAISLISHSMYVNGHTHCLCPVHMYVCTYGGTVTMVYSAGLRWLPQSSTTCSCSEHFGSSLLYSVHMGEAYLPVTALYNDYIRTYVCTSVSFLRRPAMVLTAPQATSSVLRSLLEQSSLTAPMQYTTASGWAVGSRHSSTSNSGPTGSDKVHGHTTA